MVKSVRSMIKVKCSLVPICTVNFDLPLCAHSVRGRKNCGFAERVHEFLHSRYRIRVSLCFVVGLAVIDAGAYCAIILVQRKLDPPISLASSITYWENNVLLLIVSNLLFFCLARYEAKWTGCVLSSTGSIRCLDSLMRWRWSFHVEWILDSMEMI